MQAACLLALGGRLGLRYDEGVAGPKPATPDAQMALTVELGGLPRCASASW